MTPRDHLLAYLTKIGVSHKTYDHKPVFTVAESATIKEPIPGGSTKNLFLKDDKKQLWLISALSDTQINLKQLSKKLNAKGLRFAQPELLHAHLGVEPGSVTWFALINDPDGQVNALLDKRLFEHELVGFHPLHNTATTVIPPEALRTFVESLGHPYQTIDFSLI